MRKPPTTDEATALPSATLVLLLGGLQVLVLLILLLIFLPGTARAEQAGSQASSTGQPHGSAIEHSRTRAR